MASTKLTSSLDNLDRVTGAIELAAKDIDRIANLPEGIKKRIVVDTVRELQPMIRKLIIDNFSASGVGKRTPSDEYSQTGKLRQAVSQVIVRSKFLSSGNISIVVMMPPNVAPYIDQHTGRKTPFYIVAAALNYGSVRTKRVERQSVDLPTGNVTKSKRSPIGAKAKRTVKKVAYGEDVSARAVDAVEQGRKVARGSGKGQPIVSGFHIGVKDDSHKGKATKMTGGSIVTRPFSFFELTGSQRLKIQGEFTRRITKKFSAAIGLAV